MKKIANFIALCLFTVVSPLYAVSFYPIGEDPHVEFLGQIDLLPNEPFHPLTLQEDPSVPLLSVDAILSAAVVTTIRHPVFNQIAISGTQEFICEIMALISYVCMADEGGSFDISSPAYDLLFQINRGSYRDDYGFACKIVSAAFCYQRIVEGTMIVRWGLLAGGRGSQRSGF